MDPLLSALADNGGPTQTRALPGGSPAVDFAACLGGPQDQRGYPRPFPAGGSCDSGAYEQFTCNGMVLNQPGPFPGCTLPATGSSPPPATTAPTPKKKCKKKKGKKGVVAAKKCKKKKKK
ncbi:MAG TPA: choice-of-anchor Q domain-containing protein [Solirubrobacterales bacterium]|jgi:hypothetical protein